VSSKHNVDEMDADDGKIMFDFDQGFNPQGFTQEQVDGRYHMLWLNVCRFRNRASMPLLVVA
jgi:hypothetical protein